MLTHSPVLWTSQKAVLSPKDYRRFDAVLQIIGGTTYPSPHKTLLDAVEKRHPKISVTLKDGVIVRRLVWKKRIPPFEQLQLLRKALSPLRRVKKLAVDIRCPPAAAQAVFAAVVNVARLPGDKYPPCRLFFAGVRRADILPSTVAADANTMARALAKLPPNELTVDAFAKFAKSQKNLSVKIIAGKQLAKAGAILAVARASAVAPQIVHLSHRPPQPKRRICFVGKGVCYDTGGINVKPARNMRGMKKDMAGAAAALAIVVAAATLKLPVAVDAFLVLADNRISNTAYHPDEVITALNGKRIEIVHSDAEGRMILADALTLAAREKPPADLIVSLATLTGTMQVALGTRMSGVFCTDEKWQKRALAAAADSGERLCAFPLSADYRKHLKSDIADIKQCGEKTDADHILAALFLKEFVGDGNWLHMDLSAVSCEGGLAAAPGPLTGFGVAWGLTLLSSLS